MIEKKLAIQVIKDECPGLFEAYMRIPLITTHEDGGEQSYDKTFLDFLINTMQNNRGVASWNKSK
ncbi:MAG: hypothetical protein QW555_07940 [Nitrososphaerota archaeon]